uniref:Uncharacterized protein LOC100369989 n=1 Tax=Saccoglossus kowalevskii TaxID=10224 RepID=A0ABM0MU49_SACKO|nr:PREDICTED: uncharacterized protein LOC100369989 [Saccoglossus kowalevskii]
MDDVCSDWTTHLQVEVTEVTPSGCQPTEEQPEQRDEWSAYIHVESRSSPKSLITTNHFTYCPESETRQVVNINSLYIRALQSTDLRLRFNMRILEDVDAWVENSETGTPTFDCDDLDVCNERIQNIEVHFPHGNLDICKVTVEIELYKDKSERLADILTLWVYKTHPKCVETDHNYPDFRINTELVETRQGQIQDLHIRSSIPPEDVNGILHVKLRSEFGLVSIPRVPDSLRIYSDHMAVHESIPTKMCIAGPATLVLQALESTRFTPLKDFWGRTKVEIEYGVTTTAAKLIYGDIVPKKIVNQDVVVKNGYMPTLPLLSVPRRICADERQIKHMDMVKIIARFQEKDAVTVRIYTRMGELHLSRSIHHVELSDDMMEIMERDNKQIIIRSSISLVRGFIHDVILYETPECREDYQSSPIDQITVQIMSDNGELDQSTTIVDITCVESEEAVQDIVDIAENCEKKDMLWGPWSHCSADYCGVGLQYRERSCGEPDRDERRCVKCDCKPTPVLVRNPSAYLAGCESQEPLLQCPETCEPVKMRYANHEFLCKDKDTAWIQYKPIEVHEQCICKTCTSHRSYNPLS